MKKILYVWWMHVSLILIVFTDSAWAYLDPGAGSMILQILLGGVAGVVVILKLYWRRFTGYFRRDSAEDSGRSVPHDQET